MPIEQQIHILILVLCATVVLATAATVRGGRDDRAQQVIVSAAITFGGYALVILFGRLYFSRTILASTILAVLLISMVVVWFRQRRGTKVAIIAPLVKAIPRSLMDAALLDHPSAALNRFDILLVDLHEPVSGEWARALSRAMLAGTRVRHMEEYVEEARGKASIEMFELEHLPSTEVDSYIQLKRILDILGALVLVPFAAPLVAIAAILILFTDGWPVVFIQERVGLGGQAFRMWKLRTMRTSADEDSERAATPMDGRITPLGAFLRRARIDELPQLWNVLRGDMSLIGPRPESVTLHNRYTESEPKFAYRSLVRPGITGWAQINAPASATVDEALRKLRYDLYYVKKQSLSLDVLIGLRTIWVVIRGLWPR